MKVWVVVNNFGGLVESVNPFPTEKEAQDHIVQELLKDENFQDKVQEDVTGVTVYELAQDYLMELDSDWDPTVWEVGA